MSSSGWALSAVQDVVAAVAPDREMVVCGAHRRTYEAAAQRSERLATFLAEQGLGAHRERSALERWECGQDTIALVLHNSVEYIDAMYGCFRARAVPCNVNQHYAPREIRALFDMLGIRGVVYHRSLGPRLAHALEGRTVVLLDVDDGSGIEPLTGSIAFEEAATWPGDDAALSTPSPDDLYLVCTGGTTGSPKAVLWRQADAYVAAMSGSDDATPTSIREAAAAGSGGGSPRHR